MTEQERWDKRFCWRPGDVVIHPAESDFAKAVKARAAAGLRVQGVSDEEILKWWADQQKDTKP